VKQCKESQGNTEVCVFVLCLCVCLCVLAPFTPAFSKSRSHTCFQKSKGSPLKLAEGVTSSFLRQVGCWMEDGWPLPLPVLFPLGREAHSFEKCHLFAGSPGNGVKSNVPGDISMSLSLPKQNKERCKIPVLVTLCKDEHEKQEREGGGIQL
jgi:hypothetical protein